MLVLFAAPDCSGKDCLMHELAKLYYYQPFMCPRSPICNIVYDVVYQRINTENLKKNFELVLEFLKLGAFFVYIKVQPELLIERAIARNEKHVNSLEVFKQHIDIYNTVFEKCRNKFKQYDYRFIEIDNSCSLEESSKNLREKIEKIKKEHNESEE